MAKKAERTEETQPVEVKLKPILGIRPGVYLTIIYSALLLIILFLLLFAPGLRKNGTVYTIESSPSGAAVFVDERYAGSTPAEFFVKKGPHTISIQKPYFVKENLTVDTGGRIFGTLFVKKREYIDRELEVADLEGFLVSRLSELSEWALINQFSPSYQPPRVISATVEEFYAAGQTETELLDRYLLAALRSVNGKVFIADYLRAVVLRTANGGVPSVASLARAVNRLAALFDERPGLGFLASSALEGELLAAYRESEWFDDLFGTYRNLIASYGSTEPPRSTESVRIAGLPFVLVPGGEFTMGLPVTNGAGGDFPHPERAGELYMLKGEVTRGWYADFLAANPRWNPANRDALIAEGLVDEWYLHDWGDSVDQDMPVAYVSYYAAEAFAEWFDTLLPARFAGYTARLPEESEWEWAALGYSTNLQMRGEVAAGGPSVISGRPGVENLVGSLWEWCGTWFHPADYFVKPWAPGEVTREAAFDLGAEAVVRGGSWANTKEDRVGPVARGSHPPEWCTQFAGFRIVLAEESR